MSHYNEGHVFLGFQVERFVIKKTCPYSKRSKGGGEVGWHAKHALVLDGGAANCARPHLKYVEGGVGLSNIASP